MRAWVHACVRVCVGTLIKYLHVVSPGHRKNAAKLDTHWQFSCGAVQILTLVLVLQAKEVTLCTRGWQISLASSRCVSLSESTRKVVDTWSYVHGMYKLWLKTMGMYESVGGGRYQQGVGVVMSGWHV